MVKKNYIKKTNKMLLKMPVYNINDYSIVIFGTGNTSVLYQKCFEHENIKPIYYLDNNIDKQGKEFQGIPVISIDNLNELKQTFKKPILILICSANISTCKQIQKQLSYYNFKYTTIDTFIFSNNREKILKVIELLEDDFSRKVYYNMINSRINNIPVNEDIVNFGNNFVLPQFLQRSENELFIDMGAYVGDTVENYINCRLGVFKKIIAFEPDEFNYKALKIRIDRITNEWSLSKDRIVLENAGIGAKTMLPPPLINDSDVITINKVEQNSRLGANLISKENSKNITIYCLDDYIKEQKVGLIKADIESFELDMLRGAANIIKRDKPLLYVCIYHNASDMFTIPLFLKSICKEYKIKIRQHVYDYAETVMYAYV